MYPTVVVLVSGEIVEPEARDFDPEPGEPRHTRTVEEELERLLAPHDSPTRLVVGNARDGAWSKTVPNYGARFDFWDPDEALLGHFWDRFVALTVEHRIMPTFGRTTRTRRPRDRPSFGRPNCPSNSFTPESSRRTAATANSGSGRTRTTGRRREG